MKNFIAIFVLTVTIAFSQELTTPEQLKNLSEEIKNCPNSFWAYASFWKLKFSLTKSFDTLYIYKKESEEQLSALKTNYGESDSLLNCQAVIYYHYGKTLTSLLTGVVFEWQDVRNKYNEIIEKIPSEKRTEEVNKIYKEERQLSEQIKIQQKNINKSAEEFLNKPAPEFEFETLDGKKTKLSDYKGKVILLDFWGTWCAPCVAEIPNLKKVYNEFKNKNFEIISISSDAFIKQFDKDKLREFTQNKEMNWIQVLDDVDQRIHKLYKINAWPSLFLINEKGLVIKTSSDLRGPMLENALKDIFTNKSSK